jgi:hypothetical protein
MSTMPPEIVEAIEAAAGQPVRLTNPKNNTDYVVIQAEVFERLRPLLYDDGVWTSQEKLALLQEFGRRAGWDDPELDVYEEYRKR